MKVPRFDPPGPNKSIRVRTLNGLLARRNPAQPRAQGGDMEFHETLPRRGYSRKEMMRRVARFKKLRGSDGGLPDSKMPGCERILYNVIGFQPPKTERGGKQSPVGLKAARMAAIKISEGFNLGYCRAKPGRGPMLHNHDTNETFIAMTGTWRAIWENGRGGLEHVDLKPLDVISFPPGVIRRFMNVTRGPKSKYSTLMFVIGGNAPSSEFTKKSMREIEAAGAMPGQGRRRASR